MSTPALPSGYMLDRAAPALPAGYSMDSAPTSADAPAQPRSWTDSLSDFGKELWNQVNPVAGIKGFAQLAAHPIDSLKSDASTRQQIYSNAEDAFKKGNYTQGAAHLLYAALPFIGPQLDAAGNNFAQGNYAKGAGASVGMGLSLAAPEVIKNANITLPGASSAENLSERMYQSSLKPPPGSFSQPEVQSMVKTGLENEIPVSQAGRVKLNDLVGDLNNKVQAQIDAGSAQGATVNKFDVASRLGQTAKKFATQVTPEADLSTVAKAGNEFLENQPTEIPASQAQAIKSGTYQQIGSKPYGELSSASIEAQKSLARGIKEELQTQFPEIQGMNAQESKLLGLDDALERAVNRTRNNNVFSLGGKVAGAGVAGAAGGVGGAVAGAGTAFLHDALLNPDVQSRLAIAINKASKGAVTIGAAQSRVASYVNQLGNAVNSQMQAATATPGP